MLFLRNPEDPETFVLPGMASVCVKVLVDVDQCEGILIFNHIGLELAQLPEFVLVLLFEEYLMQLQHLVKRVNRNKPLPVLVQLD